MKLAVAICTIVLGFLLLGLSTVWTSLVRAESTWTEEKAQRLPEVHARLAYLGNQLNNPKASMHTGPGNGTLKGEFDALQKEKDELTAEFQSVSDRPNKISKILKWSGIGLAIIGLIGWYAVKQSS